MKHSFTLADFPESVFDIEISIWTGRTKLYMNGEKIEQLKEKGKPFLIPTAEGEYLAAYPKSVFLDTFPVLEFNGSKHRIIERLSLAQYIVGALPSLLIILGGALGGGIGALATILNYKIFRSGQNPILKYVLVVLMCTVAYILWYVARAALLYQLQN